MRPRIFLCYLFISMAFEIIQIPHDDASVRSYLERYKYFRLYSLKTAPECFGSTYAREVAFTDDVWSDRLANPKATTFVAMQSDRIVCTLTTIGPLQCTAEEYVFHFFRFYLTIRVSGREPTACFCRLPSLRLSCPLRLYDSDACPDRLLQQIHGR